MTLDEKEEFAREIIRDHVDWIDSDDVCLFTRVRKLEVDCEDIVRLVRTAKVTVEWGTE